MPGKAYFTEEGKDLFTELLQRYSNVIESKKTDAVSLNAKAKAWERLCTEYNSMPHVRRREVKQLKKLWDNLKQKLKKAKAQQIRDVMATGGGPPPEPLDDRLTRVEALVPHVAVRVPNPFDSDRQSQTPASEAVTDIIDSMMHETDSRYHDIDDEFGMNSNLSQAVVGCLQKQQPQDHRAAKTEKMLSWTKAQELSQLFAVAKVVVLLLSTQHYRRSWRLAFVL
ncbi:myb/SANT-like DNA-binding domain-containing protein 3 [Dermacentor variabilis]|uniref:myb/SANT-like DNA-binding domain-containing protein 3 n=1 Tax=Dermacentor variabilis TaxID=34621 RepID=UPI003F5BD9DC